MIFDVALFIVGVGLLIWGGHQLVKSSTVTAHLLGISTLLISLTVVAFSTSAPELVVSVFASVGQQSDVALGNIIGSNIANIALLFGLAIVIWPIRSDPEAQRVDFPVLTITTVVVLLLARDGLISRIDGAALLAIFLSILWYHIRASKRTIGARLHEIVPVQRAEFRMKMRTAITLLIISLGALVVGSKIAVDSATTIARALGVSELVIGITLIAVGTSLPELFTIISASLKRAEHVSVGTIIGSNMFNISGILAVAALIQPIAVPASVLRYDILLMVVLTFALFPILSERIRTFRFAGILFLGMYGLYIASKFIT